jgi:hypothetical protein
MVAASWMDRVPQGELLWGADYCDIARFSTTDSAAQVAASLSCMACVGAASNVAVSLVGLIAIAICECGSCRAVTAVELQLDQARRLLADGHDSA